MTQTVEPPPPLPRTSYDEWRDRRWRLTGLAFAILWLVTAAAVGLAGEKRSDLLSLEAAISEGSVRQVEIVGLPDEAGWRGRTTVTLRWQGAVLSRYAEVEVDNRRTPGTSWEGDRIVGDPAEHLRALAPGVAGRGEGLGLTYSELTSHQEWRGWRGPGWTITLGLAAWFGTFLLVGAGPEPWRATRWAWAWLTILGGPLGCLAFLLLGGPLGLWRPSDVRRRLTGGWAFLIALVVFGGGNAA